MPFCGLVITLESDPILAQETVERLSHDPRITIGVREGLRLAVAAETHDAREQGELHMQLLADPGVVHVDTTFVELDVMELEDTPSENRT